jgi:nucleoside-diphosphate-sugar epimerase
MSHTINRLLEGGHSVIGVDNGQKWGLSQTTQYEFVAGDCSSAELLQPLLYDIDCVIQAAATLYGVLGFHRYPADILSNDLAVQKTVLECSLKAGIKRIVYISSSMVYDKSNHCSDELDEKFAVPVTDYGLSKLVCERLVQAYTYQHNLNYTIWRPFNALDPTERAESEQGISHVIPDMLQRLIVEQQNPLEILGDGNQIRCFCHIREIGEAIADFSFDSRTLNGIFNLGRHEAISMKDLALRLYDEACKQGLIVNPEELKFTSLKVPSTDVRERIGSFNKIKKAVNWTSNISLTSMIHDCVSSYSKPKLQSNERQHKSLQTANQSATSMTFTG